jgi:alkanesulfonate monooxygenase SsuD/methylene tetrahydromethanopterin reductase-like flavin-dependent oxidoreductase (luciferase family)
MEEELSRPKAMRRVRGSVRLGIFLPNQRNAFYISSAPDATDATYEEVRKVTQLAEEAGLSFALPVARWKSLRGNEVDFCPYGQETVTLAAGLLEATSRITVFSTVHTPLFNPVVAAKMGATLDHIGNGRWGMNIVAGWSQADFSSMGLELREHEDRYVEAAAWLSAVRELWTTGASSTKSDSFQLDEAECWPRPLQEGGPVVVNAGRSVTGMKFAIDNADYLFSASPTADEFKVVTQELGGNNVGYLGRKFVIVRPTKSEAEDVANGIVAGNDLRAQAQLLAHGNRSPDEAEKELEDPSRLRQVVLEGVIVGAPADVAVELAEWSASASVDGICLTLFDCERELEIMQTKVFERLGNELTKRGKTLLLN